MKHRLQCRLLDVATARYCGETDPELGVGTHRAREELRPIIVVESPVHSIAAPIVVKLYPQYIKGGPDDHLSHLEPPWIQRTFRRASNEISVTVSGLEVTP